MYERLPNALTMLAYILLKSLRTESSPVANVAHRTRRVNVLIDDANPVVNYHWILHPANPVVVGHNISKVHRRGGGEGEGGGEEVGGGGANGGEGKKETENE